MNEPVQSVFLTSQRTLFRLKTQGHIIAGQTPKAHRDSLDWHSRILAGAAGV